MQVRERSRKPALHEFHGAVGSHQSKRPNSLFVPQCLDRVQSGRVSFWTASKDDADQDQAFEGSYEQAFYGNKRDERVCGGSRQDYRDYLLLLHDMSALCEAVWQELRSRHCQSLTDPKTSGLRCLLVDQISSSECRVLTLPLQLFAVPTGSVRGQLIQR
jgi:hypothetical protein